MSIKLYILELDGNVKTDPENWKNFVPTTQVHEVYRTLISTFSSESVILVKDAKDYVDEVYNEKGVLGSISVVWKKYDFDTDSYKEIFSLGNLDLKKYKFKRDRTEVGFEPSGFVMKILNRDEITFSLQSLVDMDGGEIPSFTNETIDLELDQQTFLRRLESNEIPNIEESEELTGSEQPGFKFVEAQPTVFQINELVDNIDIKGSNFFNIETDTFDPANLPWIYKANRDVSINLKLNYDLRAYVEVETVTPTPNSSVDYFAGFNLRIIKYIAETDSSTEIYNDLIAPEEINGNSGDGSANSERVYSGLADVNTDLSEGDFIYIYIEASPRGSGLTTSFNFSGGDVRVINGIEFNTFELEVNETREVPTTNAKVMLAWEFLLRQCQHITGRIDCLRSSFYGRTDGEVHQYDEDGEGSMYALTNGKLVRGFPIEDNPINTFLMQSFKNFTGIGHLIGLGIVYEDGLPYVIIEKLTYFYDKSITAMVLQAEDGGIEWEPAMQYVWGSVKCGYPNYKNKSSFILGTAHSPKEYIVSELNNISNTIYEVYSDFVGSGHLLEQIREIRYEDDTQLDTDYDESIFIIAVERDGEGGFQRKKILDFETVENIDNPDSQYNIELHPARIILNHAPLLLSGLNQRIQNEPTNKEFLNFSYGEANKKLLTKYAGKPEIQEGVNLSLDELDGQEPLFDSSFLGRANVLLNDNQLNLFKEGFIGAVSISDQTGTYLCFVELSKQTDLENNKTELALLKVGNVPEVVPDPDPEPECDCPTENQYLSGTLEGNKYTDIDSIVFTLNFLGEFDFCEDYLIKVNGNTILKENWNSVILSNGNETQLELIYSGDVEASIFNLQFGDNIDCDLISLNISQGELTIF